MTRFYFKVISPIKKVLESNLLVILPGNESNALQAKEETMHHEPDRM